ncbi:2-dehydropantoate 2-reductase [Amycolatopsis sp. K13G38]|uniref:2-dehydropantoate 2-reductase n=1 Tax=Amycolatopsis acididurans TaxID=2724524 RepID=A0ABX1J4M1_9PSEU|nr:2-dehydropantoate 2-reductase [Amycolatopsis acididurans]NKQ54741.1 2-dehydropantoate 2-reductase [Amycolatopsis acididurans]
MSHVAVIGAGGVGTVLAAAMSDAGHEVTICARSTTPPLNLLSHGETRRLDLPVVRDPDRAGRVDWVLLCTKAHDTAGAVSWLSRLCGPETVVVVCQNGIGRAHQVKAVLRRGTVLPALVYIAAERAEAGLVVHRRGRRVVVPAEPAGRAFADLAAPVLDVDVEPDFGTAAWRKLLTNLAANPITALTGRRMDVFGDAEVHRLATAVLGEAVAVGRAEGARLGDPDVSETLDFYAAFSPDDGTSMLYDRLAGRGLEHEEFSGVVTALGRRHGIPTPANQALYALLGALTKNEGSTP